MEMSVQCQRLAVSSQSVWIHCSNVVAGVSRKTVKSRIWCRNFKLYDRMQSSCSNVIATRISINVNVILLVGKTTFDTNETDYLLMKCHFLR